MTNQVEIFRIDSIGKGYLSIMAHPASSDNLASTISEICALGFDQVVSLLEASEASMLGLDNEGMPPPALQADLLASVALGAAEDLLDGRSSRDDLVDALLGLMTTVTQS